MARRRRLFARAKRLISATVPMQCLGDPTGILGKNGCTHTNTQLRPTGEFGQEKSHLTMCILRLQRCRSHDQLNLYEPQWPHQILHAFMTFGIALCKALGCQYTNVSDNLPMAAMTTSCRHWQYLMFQTSQSVFPIRTSEVTS